MAELNLAVADAPLQALRTSQRHLAMTLGRAWKYPREVAPFAALEENTEAAARDLWKLLEPGEATHVACAHPLMVAGLRWEGPIGVRQFTYAADRDLPDLPGAEGVRIETLTCADAESMMELTAVAFPGFFRRRTCEMGRYYGIREGSRLAAMCGERMIVGTLREISGLCTHPEARGRGFAPLLLRRLMSDHRAAGCRSYLHVAANNGRAIAMYERMGFDARGEYPMFRVTREA